jgi:hypothetical protein
LIEALPSEPNHARTIFSPYQGLLLETAQAHDENHAQCGEENTVPHTDAGPLAQMARVPGVEFILALQPDATPPYEVRGLENPQPVADWSRQTMEQLRGLGERLQAGPLLQMEGLGPQSNVALGRHNEVDFCVGWNQSLSAGQIQESMKKALALWVS